MGGQADPNRWFRQKELFQEALDRDAAGRERLIAAIREDDAEMASEIAAMIEAHERDDGRLDAPLVAPPADPLLGADVDGKYRIERRIGRGGMGAVYRATHLWTGRLVAVKIIAPEFVRLPEFVERFKREARAAGRLRHPNVVNVTDFGFTTVGANRIAYLVMEYLDGLTLGDLLADRKRLPVGFVVDLLEQVCAAVDAAHAQGVLHRDLKPDNIWLEPDGRGGRTAKVLDFGIAKLRDVNADSAPDERPRPARALRSATRTTLSPPATGGDEPPAPAWLLDRAPGGATAREILPRTVAPHGSRASLVLGTPAYMSPEQCRGDGVDERSDVYAIGVIAYETLAGRPPFQGEIEALLVKHGEMPPPPFGVPRREVPTAVEAVVLGALSKSPAERPSTAGAFAVALSAAARGERHIEREASARLVHHRSSLTRLLLRTHVPFVSLAAGAIALLSLPWQGAAPASWSVTLAAWLVPLAILLVASDFGAGACAVALEQSTSPARSFEIDEISRRVWSRALAIGGAGVRGWLRPGVLFAAPIAVVEPLTTSEAVTRSRALTTRLGALVAPAYARQILVAVAMLFVMTTTFVGMSVAFGSVDDGFRIQIEPVLAAYLLTAVVGAIFSVTALPRAEMSRAALYFTARRAAGERTSADAEPRDGLLTGHAPRRRFRSHSLVASVLVACMAIGAFDFVFVPPLSPPQRLPRETIEKISDAENAWVEYKAALAPLENGDFLEYKYKADPLRQYASGMTASLEPTLREFVDRNSPALSHVIEGARRPRVQITTTPVFELQTRGPNLRGCRLLATIAAVRIRDLVDARRSDEAAELAAAAYRMGADLGAAGSTPIGQRHSATMRSILSDAVIYMARASDSPDQDLRLALALGELEDRVASPEVVVSDEWEEMHRLTEHELLDSDSELNTASFFRLFPGLRTRSYTRFAEVYPRMLDRLRPHLAEWDIAALENVRREEVDRVTSWRFWMWPENAIAQPFLHMGLYSSPGYTVRGLYAAKARCAAARALLLAEVYRKRHGAYPESLQAACDDLRVDAPVDVMTGRAVGYRLEGDAPMVWFAGFDGRDDGGHVAFGEDHDRESWLGVPGTDLVVRPGQQIEWH